MPHEALNETVYTSTATASGGRAGHVRSEDGVVDLPLGKPGSTANPKANPETLLAAGWAACFGANLNAIANREGLDTSESTVTADVTFGKTDTGFGLAAAIVAAVPGVDEAKAQELADKAHQVCAYSKATRGNIDVTVTGVPA